MSAHTMGPWRFAVKGPAKLDLGVYESHGNLLCTVQRSGSAISMDRREADARLMAAAPELLAALQSIMEDMDSNFGTGYDYNQARAAIAKAVQP